MALQTLLFFWIYVSLLAEVDGMAYQPGCNMLTNCNGHGNCVSSTKTCACFEGWGASTDVAIYKSPDCSLRTCPSGPSWADVPTAANEAHAAEECSGMGICNRATGVCNCFSGYTGSACQRTTCPNDCSGHGKCVSMKKMATLTNAMPLSIATTYTGSKTTTTWDEDRIWGCVCDSSWTTGLQSGETQTPEFFGPDCSLQHCPSGNDPLTTADETDCNGASAAFGGGSGVVGNLCHVDCSNRGICDYTSGLCTCFIGYYGENCNSITPYA